MTLHFLRWRDIDPVGRLFDPRPARAVVEPLLVAASHRAEIDRRALHDSIDRALVAEYGAWIAGWSWSAGEGGGAGLVQGYCCATHSLFWTGDGGHEKSLERILRAVESWWSVLGKLASTFAGLREECRGAPIERAVTYAASRLLPFVLEATHSEDAWYGTFGGVLSWYLESAGYADPEIREAIQGIVSGRFQSWVTPAEDLQRQTCTELGEAVARVVSLDDVVRDATAAWLRVRELAFERGVTRGKRDPVSRDGHRRFIEGKERLRDPLRAHRMLQALEACRASARRGEPLTFEAMAAWQALVLGEGRVAFRTGDAFAKEGRECYPLGPTTAFEFAKALRDADGPDPATVHVRAARVYQDVCFFHPFEDGNARAARLALDHVLTRASLALHSVEPIFVVSRAADDPHAAWSLAYVIDHLAGPAS